MNLNDLNLKILAWAHDRDIVEGGTRQAQLNKLTEELGELAKGINKGREDMVVDGIGDCFVVLAIIAAQSGASLEHAVGVAWDEIKDRKGRMICGTFVKESDIHPGREGV